MASVSMHELVRRRIPHVAAAYLAGGWGVLEFTDWATTRFGGDPEITNAVVLGLALMFPVALAIAWKAAPRTGAALTGHGRPARRSIAVLPFANPGGDPANEYLSDGLTDEIIDALSRLEGLRVAARTSSFAFKGRTDDVRLIGRELNVESVLEGTVQRAGERLRVKTRLVNTADGFHLWSERYDRELADVFAIEDEIAASVAGALRVLLRDDERRALRLAKPSDIRAYEFYLRGRQFFHQMRKKSLQYAREMFERAVEIDPHYARAHAGIAEASAVLRMYYPTSDEDLARADAASLRALELAPDLPEARFARGFALFLMKRIDEAEREFRFAIDMEPQLYDAHYFWARSCFQVGRFDEAARHFDEANAIREDYQAAFFGAQALEAGGHGDDAMKTYERAQAIAARHMEFNPDDPRAATIRAVSLCRAGRPDEGLHWAEQALAIDPEDAGIRYNVACLFALEGKKDRAFDCLDDAIRAGFGNREWLEKDPDLTSLRDEPRFGSLLASLPGP
jgi:TolB-like protein/Tfp pilus assembly protein PilF